MVRFIPIVLPHKLIPFKILIAEAVGRSAGRLAGRLYLGDKDNIVVGELLQQEIVEIVDLNGVKRLQIWCGR